MSDKREARRSIKQLQRIKTWQLVILLVLSVFVSATFLRLNNIGMVERRDAVLSADETGDDEVTTLRLYDLQRYVSAHMNTDMSGGVYLEASYRRDTKGAYDGASLDSNPNGNIYKKAQAICAPKFTGYSYAYLQCTTDELAKYPSSSNLISSVNLPLADSYKHIFVSPIWSPDFAGWSVLVSVVLVLMIVIRFIAMLTLQAILKRHFDDI